MRTLSRLWQYFNILEAKVLAGEAELFVGPRLENDLDSLVKARGALVRRHAKGGELDPGKAAPRTPIGPTAGQQVEQRHLLGEAQRMVERGQRHRRADAQPLGARGGQRPDHMHRGTDAKP